MIITPQEFLDALEFWKKQAKILIENPINDEFGWGDILQDMEDYARSNEVEQSEFD